MRTPRTLVLAILLAGCAETKAPVKPTAPLRPMAPMPTASAPASAAVNPKAGPPVAPVRPVTDSYFGVTVADPYRWMEQEGSQELGAWMRGQADWTRKQLDALPYRAQLLERLRAVNKSDRVYDVGRYGDSYFYTKRAADADNYKLYVRKGLGAPERLLVDPETLGKGGSHVSLDWFFPSLDGKLVAYGISPSGSEDSVLHVMEAESGKLLPDTFDRMQFGSVVWIDAKRFFYTRLQKLAPGAPETEKYKRAKAYVHTLGADADKDPAVLGTDVIAGVSVGELESGIAQAAPGCATVFGLVIDGVRNEFRLYSAPKTALAGGKTPWKAITSYDDGVTSFDVRGDDLYLLTHKGASRFKVLKTSAARPNLAKAEVVVPESNVVIKEIHCAKDAMYLRVLDAGVGRLQRWPYRGAAEAVAMPFDGSLEQLFTFQTSDGAVFRATGWTVSPRVLAFKPGDKQASDTGLLPPAPADFSAVTSLETKVKSKDGTMVPLSIVFRKDLAKDGSHPTWLDGYGGYGISIEPAFDPTRLVWLERGGVHAYCHGRGGGELGEDWHQAGMLLHKQNGIDDFLACAQGLIDLGFTRPDKLAGEGTSAGGMLIGGAITQRPELFGAALIRVGVSNALRFEQTVNVLNTAEMGTVKTEEGFKALYASDAYSHVKDGTRYPAVLLTTGVTDPRVSPWQVTKMAARLQAATSSGKPVLLRVDYDAGHGLGSTKSQRELELADLYAFLWWQLGGS